MSGSFTPARFELVRCIGGGATGEVYEAVDRESGAPVALKALRRLNPETIARFKQEFRALQEVQHPNLINLGELLEEDGQLYFTMELVRGADFLGWVRPAADVAYAETRLASMGSSSSSDSDRAPRVRRHRRLGVLQIERLRDGLRQLAGALVALHDAGKVHRDIKPSNVLVDERGRVVVLDLGLVADADRADSWGDAGIVGTPDYMAPEQASGQPAGPAADWYAVGVMLFEALTGQLPFDGSLMEVLIHKQQSEPPRVDAREHPDLAALCQRLLAREASRRPDDDQVLRALGAATSSEALRRVTTFTHGPYFVGRDAETARLRDALDAHVREQHPVAVLIGGESGVGKSTLVRRFTEALDRDEVAVLPGRCHERESVSFKAFDGMVDALARYLARMEAVEVAALLPLHAWQLAQVFPVLKRIKLFAEAPRPTALLDQSELRAHVFGALRELLQRLAQRRRLVMVIDDLQWADADSLALLGDVLRGPDAPPLLLLATMRPRPGDGGVDPAIHVRAVCADSRDIALAPLTTEESRRLAEMLARSHGVQTEVDVDALAAEAGGHPLFIDELVRHCAGGGGSSGAQRLEDALWARVSLLDAEARTVLELAAVAAGPMLQETVAHAADVGAPRFSRMVSLLRLSNLARTTGARGTDTIEPYHDRVRQAVIGHMSPARRTELHRQLAVALEAGTHPGRESALALHWGSAGRMDLAARYADAAARAAAAELAFDRAARFFRTALDLGHPERAGLLAGLGAVLSFAGRGAEAAVAYLAASTAETASAAALEFRRRAAEQLLISGHIDEGIELIGSVLAAVDLSLPKTPRRALISLLAKRAFLRVRGVGFEPRQEGEVPATELTRIDLCWSVARGLGIVDNIRGADFQTRHLLLALRAGEPTRVARALAVEGGFIGTGGEKALPRARELFDHARTMIAGADAPHPTALIMGAECVCAYQSGRFAEAIERARSAEGAFRTRCPGSAWELDTIQSFYLYALFYLGRLTELVQLTPAWLRLAQARGDLYACNQLRAGLATSAWLVGGQVDEAYAQVDEAERNWAHWEQRGYHVQHYHQLLARANIDLYRGDAASAMARIEREWPQLAGSLLLRVSAVRIEGHTLRGRCALARAAELPAGERAPLLAVAERDARKVRKEVEHWARGLSALLLAGCAHLRDDRDDAIDALHTAIEHLDAAELAGHAAAARHHLGTLLGGSEGGALHTAAVSHFGAHGVADLDAWIRMLAPGF
jgi:eukaryotic-like serine/threonine-protein kinase